MSRNIVPVPMSNDLLKYINCKDNRCQYIRDLIRKDMEKGNGLDKDIKKFIEDYIKNNFSNIGNNNSDSISDCRNEINKIFDM